MFLAPPPLSEVSGSATADIPVCFYISASASKEETKKQGMHVGATQLKKIVMVSDILKTENNHHNHWAYLFSNNVQQ